MACCCSSTAMAEKISWNCALFVAVMLVLSSCESSTSDFITVQMKQENNIFNNQKVCDEIYVVREGETLQTISEKCGDPYIVEENPHIHDPDDVFPGLVIKINPFIHRS
ncbi:LysM domain [Sesbania bispinosa]|nr:LysM domain [Sesbania bispinosa]